MPNFEIDNQSHAEYDESFEKLPKPVYYIESPEDKSVLIGIDVTLEKTSSDKVIVSWYDTVRERSMLAAETKTKDDMFAFQRADSDEDEHYLFTPMSLDIYNEHIKSRLQDGPDFNSIDDLNEAFLHTKHNRE
jgi:hypothetical protein